MAEDELNLKWDDHKNNISRSIKDLREDDDFLDVTLVGDDGQQVSAHKVILSTCSQYFKKVLKQNKHPHPLLCLWGLNHSDLKNILDYIYSGEILLVQEEVNRFLEVAQKLELDGAFQKNNLKEAVTSEQQIETANEIYFMTDGGECKNIGSEFVPKYDEPPATFKSDSENLAELDRLVLQGFSKNSANLYQCNHCPKSFTTTSHAKDHVECHIEGLSFPCKYCGKSFKTRHQRRSHESHERKTFIQKQRMENVVMIPNELPPNMTYHKGVHENKKLEILRNIAMSGVQK